MNGSQKLSGPGAPAKGVGIRAGFSVLMFGYWAIICTGSFHSLFFSELGFDSGQVGVIMALNFLMGMIMPPLWGNVADKQKNIKTPFIVSIVCLSVLSGLLPLCRSILIGTLPLAVILYPLYFGVHSASYSLLDSWTIKLCNQSDGKYTYSSIRLFGSLGYAISSMLVAYFAGFVGVALPYFVGFFVGLFVLAWVRKRPQPVYTTEVKATKVNPLVLFQDPRMVFFILFAFVQSISLCTPGTFMPWLLRDVSAEPTLTGSISGFKVLFEATGLLLGGSVLVKRFKPTSVLLMSGVLFVADHALLSVVGVAQHIFMVQAIEGMAWGLFLSCAAQYIYRIAPEELTASSQSMLVTAQFAGNIVSSLLGGWMIGLVGIRVLFQGIAVLQLASTILFAFSLLRGRRQEVLE